MAAVAPARRSARRSEMRMRESATRGVPRPTYLPVVAHRAVERPVKSLREIARDMARCGEMWGDVERCGEIWGA